MNTPNTVPTQRLERLEHTGDIFTARSSEGALDCYRDVILRRLLLKYIKIIIIKHNTRVSRRKIMAVYSLPN